jgi:hypothetical protein
MEPSVFRVEREDVDGWGSGDWYVYRGSKDDRGRAICCCELESDARRIARLLELAAAWNDEAILTRADVVLRDTEQP